MKVDVRERSAPPRRGGQARPRMKAPPHPLGASSRNGPAVGSWIAVATGVLTVVTFALALTALPDQVPYPFTDPVIAQQWPGDYLWMFPAMALMVLFVAFIAVLHQRAEPGTEVFSLVAVCLATVSAAVLLVDYYLQATVVPLSLEQGRLEGWAMLTQYNPAGVFIALEELGYLLMSLALLCTVPTMSRRLRAGRVLRRLLVASSGAVLTGLVVVSATLGRERGDVFEILVISVVWVTLIVASPLVAVMVRRETPARSGS